MRRFALVLSLVLAAPAAVAQPAAPDPAAGAVGGAIALPEFNLSAEPTALEAQLALHRERLSAGEEQLARAADPALSILVDQLRFRISLLEMILAPLPTLPVPPAERAEVLASLESDRATLAELADRGKQQGIGATNQAVLDTRLAELNRLIATLRGDVTPPEATPPAAPPAPDPDPAPAPPTAPAPGTPPPADPAPAPTPPRLTLGDLMSTIANVDRRLDEVERLPQPLDPSRVFVVRATDLVPGNGGGPVGRAVQRGYFEEVRTYLAATPALADALRAAGFTATDAIGVMAEGAGNVIIFVDG